MQFLNTILPAAVALASLASAANSVAFINQDQTVRNVVFTSESDLDVAQIPTLVINGSQTVNQTFPTGWIGNFYSYNQGSENVPGMLGEVRFDGWNGLVFFDVSAIVNATDTDGVKQMYPQGSSPSSLSTPVSGCNTVGVKCLNQYNSWDDVATQSTQSSNLVCLLGNLATTTRRRHVEVYPRSYVTGTEDSSPL